MSMPIARQGEQFDVFDGDRWARDRRASISEDDVADMLGGPQIQAGLLNTRQATGGPTLDPDGPWPGIRFPEEGAHPDPADHYGQCPKCHEISRQMGGSNTAASYERAFRKHHGSRRHAVDVRHMPPDAHAYHQMPNPDAFENGGAYPGTGGQGSPWEPSEGFERAQEEQSPLVDQDDESGYNWGPEPGYDPRAEQGLHPDFHGDAPHPFGTPTFNPRSAPYDHQATYIHADIPDAAAPPAAVGDYGGALNGRDGTRTEFLEGTGGEMNPFDVSGISGNGHPTHGSVQRRQPPSFNEARRHTADGGPSGELFNPLLFMPGDRQRWESDVLGAGGEHAAPSWPTAAAAVPNIPAPVDPVWLGHGYAPGNRIGLPWRDGTIPGTVTHLDGPKIGVRWDDGQHSTEEPQDIHRLH